MNKKPSQNGYTLLFAVLLSSLVLSIGISILTISRKELILSSSTRESQISFYAADSGAECAIYHDERGEFATTSLPSLPDVTCNDQHPDIDVSYSFPGTEGDPIRYYFEYGLGADGDDAAPCAKVWVTKAYIPAVYGGPYIRPVTQIEARGYNTCLTSDSRRTERAIQLTY